MRTQNEAGYYLMVELQGCVELEKNHAGKEHFHPFWELIWAQQPVKVTCEGVCRTTRCALLPAGQKHFVCSEGQSCSMLYLGFRFSGSGNLAPETGEDLAAQLPCLPEQCEKLLALPPEKFMAARMPVLQLLGQVVEVLTQNSAPVQPGRSAVMAEKVKQLCDPYNSYTVRQMAAMLYVTPGYLSDVFRTQTGMRIKEYQTLLRMEEALSLLLSTDLSVAEIALRLGYTTPSYFIRCFEQQYHQPPGFFRRAAGET